MITELKHSIKEKKYSSIIKCIESIFPPTMIENISFFKHYGRMINFDNPEFFDELLHIYKCREYYNNKLVSLCADKIAVRDYVTEKGYDYILNDLYCTGEAPENIGWESLPNRFVVKCNHGCGYNIIVKDKVTFDINKASEQLRYWLSENYALKSGEYHYGLIKPRILCEKYIGSDKGQLPIDYKFFCTKGKILCVLIVTGRGTKVERIFVDENFEDLHFVNEYTGGSISGLKPSTFQDMTQVAKALSIDFPLVRVDLYDINGRVVFGELTFSPHGCYHDYLNKEIQKELAKEILMEE